MNGNAAAPTDAQSPNLLHYRQKLYIYINCARRYASDI